MNWTHVLAFGLGALWMLIIFVTASAMRTPQRRFDDESEPAVPRAWRDLHAEPGTRNYAD